MMLLNAKDWAYFALLTLSACYIWFSNTSWMTGSEDVAPLLLGIPLAIYLGWPWNIQKSGRFLHTGFAIAAIVCFLLGVISSFMTPLALAFVFGLYAWVKTNLNEQSQTAFQGLSILAFMSFPWLICDFSSLGWYFRYSGAAVTSALLQLFGFHTVHAGTDIEVNGIGIFVEPACSGLNTLQAMIIAGTVLAFFMFDKPKKIFTTLPLLIVAAWIANTVRIFITSLFAIFISAEFVRGEFHLWIGWVTIMLMFCVTYLMLKGKKETSPFALFSWALLIYSLIASHELLDAWQHSLFDQEGWAACVIWVAPLFFISKGQFSAPWAIATLCITTASLLGELHALAYIGLAFAIGSFFNRLSPFSIRNIIWLLTSLSWMPLLGWLLQAHITGAPDMVLFIRLGIATIGALVLLL